MALFRHIVLSALLVGALSGLIVTAVELWQVIPIIQSAERYEAEAAAAPGDGHAAAEQGHEHADGGQGDQLATDEWAPEDGLERTGFTLMANILTAIGLALVIHVAIIASLRARAANTLNWRHGLLWGAAGYAVFFLAPSLGLPPEIPGTVSAAVEARRLWWLLAAACTAAGLAGVAFGRHPWRWAALGLLVVPHLVGAPHPETGPFPGQSPDVVLELTELTRQFFGATAITSAVLWLTLGLASVWTIRRFVSPSIDPLEE